MLGRVAKIPIANTFSELVEMHFADYGDYAAFLHIRDTFARFRVSVFIREKEKGDRTAEMSCGSEIPNWLAVFGAPGILVVRKDMGVFRGNISELLLVT